jgi:hypothetical protein
VSLQGEILGLSFGYALLGALLLLAVTRARLPWPVKAGAIVVTSAFYILVFFRTQGLLGWSTPQAVPARFQLLWARTVEPDLADQVPGAIHLWLEELDDANLPSGMPRAYRLPYSTALARKVEAARVEIMNGRPQGGRALDFGGGGGEAAPDGPPAPPTAVAEPGGDPTRGGFSIRPFSAAIRNQSNSPRCRHPLCRPKICRDAGG